MSSVKLRGAMFVALSVSCLFAPALPVMADALSTPVTYNPGAKVCKYQERISFLKEQIGLAESKNWISAEQASKFRADAERLSAQEQKATSAGMSHEDDMALEKEVTAVHHYLHYAIAGGKEPAKTVEVASEPSVTAPVATPTKKTSSHHGRHSKH